MTVIEHKMAWGSYAKGQRSSWPDHLAERLIAQGLAVPVSHDGEKVIPERRGVADKMIRKVKRPVKE